MGLRILPITYVWFDLHLRLGGSLVSICGRLCLGSLVFWSFFICGVSFMQGCLDWGLFQFGNACFCGLLVVWIASIWGWRMSGVAAVLDCFTFRLLIFGFA